jgi:hypothetical protein
LIAFARVGFFLSTPPIDLQESKPSSLARTLLGNAHASERAAPAAKSSSLSRWNNTKSFRMSNTVRERVPAAQPLRDATTPFRSIEEVLMKRFLIVVVLIVVAIGGLGYYREWFHIGSDRTNGNDRITFTVDEEKIKEDEKKAKDKADDLSKKAKDAVAKPTEKKKD